METFIHITNLKDGIELCNKYDSFGWNHHGSCNGSDTLRKRLPRNENCYVQFGDKYHGRVHILSSPVLILNYNNGVFTFNKIIGR